VLFGLASLLLMGAIGYGAFRVVEPRLVAHDVTEAQRQVLLVAKKIVEPALVDGVVTGNPIALAQFDLYVRERVLRPGILQVKLWSDDGTILYSNAEGLIGRQFELESAQRALLEAGRGSSAEPAELVREEHAGLPTGAQVTEIYAVIEGPNGEHLLWESYVERHSLVEQAESLLLSLGLTGAVAASLLLTAQVALALELTRQVMQARETRIDLLRRAVSAANAERRRIASDLHDGVVQDLHGLAFDLDAAGAAGAGAGGAPAERAAEFASRLRHSLHDLRTLATDIHPPDLHSQGLRVALERLLQRCDGRVDATLDLDLDHDLDLDLETRELVFRMAQEAVRNVLAHAHASHLALQVRRRNGLLSLTVTDDGRGFEVGSAGVSNGHLGLALIDEMAQAAGGRLVLRSAPRSGTTLRVEVPA